MSAGRRNGGVRDTGLKGSAPVFSALGDGIRLGLIARLVADGPMSIARLTAGTGVTRQAITKHLRVLADAGVVRGIRHGRESIWELAPQRLHEARRCLERLSKQWDDSLARLKLSVER